MQPRTIVIAASSLVLGLMLGLATSYLYFLSWVRSYPNADDPKNIDYVLWTKGLNKNMNLDSALSAMVHDVNSERLIRGRTREQLVERFGVVRDFQEAGPYMRLCPNARWPEGTKDRKEFLFLRDSAYMVVMEKGRASELVLCKGY